jgi:DNA replication protein DnaC
MEPCTCQAIGWRQERVQQMVQSSGFPLDALLYTLEDFQRYKTAYRYAGQLVEGPVSDGKAEKPGLLLMGVAGAGKTTLASIIYQKRIEAGYSGAWINYLELQDNIRATYEPSYDGPGKANLIEALVRVDFLALDDLGSPTRANKQYAEDMIDVIYHVADARYNQHRATLITTNLDVDTLTAQFGVRVVSRLRGLCHGATMKGIDFRTGELR